MSLDTHMDSLLSMQLELQSYGRYFNFRSMSTFIILLIMQIISVSSELNPRMYI